VFHQEILNHAFAEKAAGNFLNLAFKGLSTKYKRNSLFREKAACKFLKFYFNGQSSRKIQIALLVDKRLAIS
jgi:hypothetical protein